MGQYQLQQNERLKSRKAIGELFSDGSSFFAFPFKVVYKVVKAEDKAINQAAFSVSKRIFKKAVDRNRVKRLMRESYRMNKSILNESVKGNSSCRVMFIYSANEIFTITRFNSEMKKTLNRLVSRIQQKEKDLH